jgi:hypothetical protein
VALWALVALLLVRGAAGVLASESPSRAVSAKRIGTAPAVWPDEEARAFAAGFARAYLSYSPWHPVRYLHGLERFMAPELAAAAVPRFAGQGSEQLVMQAVIARVARVDDDRALITVAVGLAGDPGQRYLAVPVARDQHGGLAIDDLPAFVASPPPATLPAPDAEPLPGAERPEVSDVLARFFRAFLAGDNAGLRYLVATGERVRALSSPLALAGVDSVSALPSGAAARRVLLVAVRARDAASGAVYRLRYRVGLVRSDRWYVASVNSTPKEG